MNEGFAALANSARAIASGMMQPAATQPDDARVESNVGTLRETAGLLTALASALAEQEQRSAALLGKMRRIANLEVRGGAALIQDGKWHMLAAELQSIAQEAFAAATGTPAPALPGREDRQPGR